MSCSINSGSSCPYAAQAGSGVGDTSAAGGCSGGSCGQGSSSGVAGGDMNQMLKAIMEMLQKLLGQGGGGAGGVAGVGGAAGAAAPQAGASASPFGEFGSSPFAAKGLIKDNSPFTKVATSNINMAMTLGALPAQTTAGFHQLTMGLLGQQSSPGGKLF